jgi:hypothetical protein
VSSLSNRTGGNTFEILNTFLFFGAFGLSRLLLQTEL